MAQKKNGICTVLFLWNCFRLVMASSWVLQKSLVCFCICLWKFLFKKYCKLRTCWSSNFHKKLKTYALTLWKFNKYLKRDGVILLHLFPNLIWSFKTGIIKKSDTHPLLWNFPIHSIHWLKKCWCWADYE